MFDFINPAEVILVVTCHNQWQTTKRCIESLRQHTPFYLCDLIVVDDFSDEEESIRWYGERCPEKVIRMEKNLHHNHIVGLVLDETKDRDDIKYVAALNNDILVTDYWLENMLLAMDGDPAIALMGCKDNMDYHLYQNFPVPDEFKPERNGYLFGDDSRFQEYIQREFYAKRRPGSYVSTQTIDGVVMMFRNSLTNDIGNINPEFYEYAGDSEFFIRAINKGYKVAYCLSSFVYHMSGGAGGKYEAFQKYYGHSLAEAAARAAALIESRYHVNIRGHGMAHTVPDEVIAANEKELTKI